MFIKPMIMFSVMEDICRRAATSIWNFVCYRLNFASLATCSVFAVGPILIMMCVSELEIEERGKIFPLCKISVSQTRSYFSQCPSRICLSQSGSYVSNFWFEIRPQPRLQFWFPRASKRSTSINSISALVIRYTTPIELILYYYKV